MAGPSLATVVVGGFAPTANGGIFDAGAGAGGLGPPAAGTCGGAPLVPTLSCCVTPCLAAACGFGAGGAPAGFGGGGDGMDPVLALTPFRGIIGASGAGFWSGAVGAAGAGGAVGAAALGIAGDGGFGGAGAGAGLSKIFVCAAGEGVGGFGGAVGATGAGAAGATGFGFGVGPPGIIAVGSSCA